jgi:hypothetical protein
MSMAKIILLPILLMVVYQFDDLVRALHFVFSRLRRGKYKQLVLDSDHYVGTALAIAGMPMALNFLLVSEQPLGTKLLIIAGLFLLAATLTFILGTVLPRLRHVHHYEGVSAFVTTTYAIAGMFQPMFRTVQWHGGRAQGELGKLAFLLSLPALLGFGFKWFFGQYDYQDEFIKYMDVLIIVMVGGMFIHLVISPARRYLGSRHMGMMGLMRVVVGLGISLLLFM